MKRVFVGAGLALLVCTLTLLAEIDGKFVKFTVGQGDKPHTVTFKVDGKEQTLPVAKDVKIVQPGKKKMLEDVPGGLSGISDGADMKITTEKKDDKEVVTKIEVAAGKKKKDK